MSGLAELSQRHARLQDISGIVTAMKSLSLVETRKLARFIGHQQRMLANIEAAAADFLQCHPEVDADEGGRGGPGLLVLVGSERGFCGNFNERIVQALDLLPDGGRDLSMVVVGQRLATRLPAGAKVLTQLDGATVSEDVPAVLDRLLDALRVGQAGTPAGPGRLLCLGHDEAGEPALTQLLPLRRPQGCAVRADAPGLLLPAPAFYRTLLDEYLLAALHGQLYLSLAAESHQRLAHMENALDRLEDTLRQLVLRRNSLRQELIVEEIEVLLSSAMASESRGEGAHSLGRTP
jgi:F-type H+-transporting ATPase subunit gamma